MDGNTAVVAPPSAQTGGAPTTASWWPTPPTGWPGLATYQQAIEYWIDAWQRSILFLDVLRQRGNQHFQHMARKAPNVLSFAFELVLDGRTFDRPVNYGLVRIIPPAGATPDPRQRPFIVFDPRAGHGPGIGGMKHASEIGVAIDAGHPCYFVGFLPDPVPGQTIEDVCRAEVRFVEKVAELHPEAESKPCLIGNCQAGWQIMMMSAIRPDLVGPLLLAGSPLSYWAGVRGKNPLRYLGGLLGGTWLNSLAGDLGNDIFDGANLIANFENLHPSNTLWKKDYHVFSNVDTEAPRFLDFERYWGSPVLLNAAEMQFIADELFVGNKLSVGEIFTSDGVRIDLRNIKSPIVVFCSWGDDITPPQQALGWITDIYDTDEALIAGGQTIVYALHQSIGHLGIFVSAKVASKEHEEFAHTMDLIDALPPGLYEAVFVAKGPQTARAELVSGDYFVRFEKRGLGDIRALGGNEPDEDRRFATVARLSEINQGVYRTFVSPFVRLTTNELTATWVRSLHPHRVRFELLSDRNPWLQPIGALADNIRAERRPVARDNPFFVQQEAVSDRIVEALDRYTELRDRAIEAWFLNLYGSPLLQAAVGMRADSATSRWRLGRDLLREATQARNAADLAARAEHGGLVEAGLRALGYIARGQPRPAVDERAFATLRQLRQHMPEARGLSLSRFKEIVREQAVLLQHNEARALATLPQLLPADAAARQAAFQAIRTAIEAVGDIPDEVRQRLARIAAIFGVGAPVGGPPPAAPAETGPDEAERSARRAMAASHSRPPRRSAGGG